MLNCAQRFFFLLKQAEHVAYAPSSWLLVFPFVLTRLRGLFFVWRILSSSQDQSWNQCEALAKSWDYEVKHIICICFCNRIGCWKTDRILIISTVNLSWPPAWSRSAKENDPGLRVPELEPDWHKGDIFDLSGMRSWVKSKEINTLSLQGQAGSCCITRRQCRQLYHGRVQEIRYLPVSHANIFCILCGHASLDLKVA